jgi:hypothetical protein
MAFLFTNPPLNLVLMLLGRMIVFLLTFSFDSDVIAIDDVYVGQSQLNLADVQLVIYDFCHFYLVLAPVLLMAFLSTNLS